VLLAKAQKFFVHAIPRDLVERREGFVEQQQFFC